MNFYSITLPNEDPARVRAWYDEMVVTMANLSYDNNPYHGFHWQATPTGLYVSVCTLEQPVLDNSFRFIQKYLSDMGSNEVAHVMYGESTRMRITRHGFSRV